MLTAQDLAYLDDDLSAADLHVMQCLESWVAEPGNSPSELLQAMADFVQSVVIEARTSH